MDKINLSKLKAGDAVKFLCGGDAVVESSLSLGITGNFALNFEGSSAGGLIYCKEGCWVGGMQLLNIVEIIPKPFDWSDVKQGMAFVEHDRDKVLYWLCKNEFTGYFILLSDMWDTASFELCDKGDLRRAPEHDKEVK